MHYISLKKTKTSMLKRAYTVTREEYNEKNIMKVNEMNIIFVFQWEKKN